MPKSKRLEFDKKGFDELQWNKYFRRYQQEYICKRLRAIKLFDEKMEVSAICQELDLNQNTFYHFLRQYLESGFAELFRKTTRQHKTHLTTAQELLFKQTIITQRPSECDW